jgi:two-component system, LytTR family, response regulator
MQAVIVDDELKGRNLLKELLTRSFPELEVAAMARNAEEGVQFIRRFNPDLIFLDVNMPGKTGFEMLQDLQPVSFEVVFVTAYHEFAIRAFKYNAFDYILKPIDYEELDQCMTRLREKQRQHDVHVQVNSLLQTFQHPRSLPERIMVHSMDGMSVIPIQDIIYLEAAGAYSIFYIRDQDKLISSLNLKEYEDLLGPHRFFRVHHSYLINLAEVKKFVKTEGGHVLMSNGDKVDVSKRRKDDFIQLLTGV